MVRVKVKGFKPYGGKTDKAILIQQGRDKCWFSRKYLETKDLNADEFIFELPNNYYKLLKEKSDVEMVVLD